MVKFTFGMYFFSCFLCFIFLKDLADQANAVLNACDEKNCNGFMKRQALYSCLTCAPDAKTDFDKAIGRKILKEFSKRLLIDLSLRDLFGLLFELS
jgi:hypothetical protein